MTCHLINKAVMKYNCVEALNIIIIIIIIIIIGPRLAKGVAYISATNITASFCGHYSYSSFAVLLHDLLSSHISQHCVWSGITGHNITPEKRDNNYTPHPVTPLRASAQSSTYNWHLSLFWVSVAYTLTGSCITVSRVSATLEYHFTF